MDGGSTQDKTKFLSHSGSFSSVNSDFPDSLHRYGSFRSSVGSDGSESDLSCVPPLPPLPPVAPGYRVESFDKCKMEELENLYKLQAKLDKEGAMDVEREAEIQSKVSDLFVVHFSGSAE